MVPDFQGWDVLVFRGCDAWFLNVCMLVHTSHCKTVHVFLSVMREYIQQRSQGHVRGTSEESNIECSIEIPRNVA